MRRDIEVVLDKWANEAVLGWFSGASPFSDADKEVVRDMAPIIGALPSEVAIMNALTGK